MRLHCMLLKTMIKIYTVIASTLTRRILKQMILFGGLILVPFLTYGQFAEDKIIHNCQICFLSDGVTIDLDQDGDLDFVFSSRSDEKIGWFENNGKGNFSK